MTHAFSLVCALTCLLSTASEYAALVGEINPRGESQLDLTNQRPLQERKSVVVRHYGLLMRVDGAAAAIACYLTASSIADR